MTAIGYPARPGLLLALRAPRPLLAWIAAEVSVATAVFVVVVAAVPLRRDIALPWPGLPPIVALAAGLCFWVVLGLLGGSQSRSHPSGAVMTFNMPFIVGGTILGGPLAGALLGLAAEIELRELREVEWYGVLSNHATSILCAVGAGLIGELLRTPIGAILPGQSALALFVISSAIAITYTILNVVLVLPILALRRGTGIREASLASDPSFRDRSLVEGLLAWLLAVTYLQVGWWATVACVALVAVAWRAHETAYQLEHDPMTGALSERGVAPRLSAAIDAARLGRRGFAYIAADLDRLWNVNQILGSIAGDDLLRGVATRLKDEARAIDAVARKASTGDEFSILLVGMLDLAAARAVAARIQTAVRRPLRLRGREGVVEVRPGVAIGLVFVPPGSDMTLADVRDLAERRLAASKCRQSRIVWSGNGPTKAEEDAHIEAKTRARDEGLDAAVGGSPRKNPRRRRTDRTSDGRDDLRRTPPTSDS